jgi:flagellar basal-body rod protein FlgC
VLEASPQGESFDDMLAPGAAASDAVKVARVVEDLRPPQLVFDPGHPDADDNGYVAMPNVNVITEMVDLMSATRAYEANVAALNATKRVLEAALEIGRA